MKKLTPLLVIPLLLTTPALAQLTLLSNTPAGTNAGEILSFDPGTDRLFITRSTPGTVPIPDGIHGIHVFDLTNPAAPTVVGSQPFIDFTSGFSDLSGVNVNSLTSVQVDPLGRGFGVATYLPNIAGGNADNSVAGRIGFFNVSTGAILHSLSVGYHPDSITFSPDGSKILVANEAQYSGVATALQRNGSVSVVDVSSVTSVNFSTQIPSLTSGQVNTVDFTGVTLPSGFRAITLPGAGGTESVVQAIEPEFVAISADSTKAYVTLQENNSIGVLSLTSNTWTNVYSLGTTTLTADARSNATPSVTDAIKVIRMPDAIAAKTIGGTTYLFTANEGDTRDADAADRTAVNSGPLTGLEGSNLPTEDLDADPNTDPVAFGGRSFSVIDAGTGTTVFDSGSFFESYIAANDAAGFVDTRSPLKGPEPEGLTLGEIDGLTYLFVGMERNNAIFMFDVTNPLAPFFVDYKRVTTPGTAPTRPEGMQFISAADSPTGQNLLAVGFEGNDRFAVFSVVPEPTSAGLLALGTLGLLGRRRRR